MGETMGKMKTASEILIEHIALTELGHVKFSHIIAAMKAYAKQVLEEAAKVGVINTGDPIQYSQADKKYILNLINELK
jgi:hypothetical protein